MLLKKSIYLVCGLFLMIACKSSQFAVEIPDEIQKSTRETYSVLSVLSSDQCAGREPGTKGYAISAQYVEDYLKKNKIKPLFNGSYKDTVLVEGDLSYNIVGVIGDYNPKKDYILLGAHLDHLGEHATTEDHIFNGADDNASGVTSVLQIARQLKKESFDKNIIVALFTGEEKGLIGSTHLAKRLKEESYELSYMLNFEMIGTRFFKEANTVFLTGNKLSNCASEMNKVLGRDFVKPFKMEEELQLYYRSDNVPFYEAYNVPCHTISSYDFETHAHYHEVNDEIEVLDVNNMQDIINSSVKIIKTFLEADTQLRMNE